MDDEAASGFPKRLAFREQGRFRIRRIFLQSRLAKDPIIRNPALISSHRAPPCFSHFRVSRLRETWSCCRRRDGHAGRAGFPHQLNLRRGQAVGLVDEVAEGGLQVQDFGGEGAGGFDAAGVFISQGVKAGGGQVFTVKLIRIWFLARPLLLGAAWVTAQPVTTTNHCWPPAHLHGARSNTPGQQRQPG